MNEMMIPVCEQCHRPAVLILAGPNDEEVYFHMDDSTPVIGCTREPLVRAR